MTAQSKSLSKTTLLTFGAVLIAMTTVLSGCSDSDSGSSDDDSGNHAHSKSVGTMCANLGAASFQKCAAGVLVSAHVSEEEQTSLSACDFELATAKQSPRDVFEVARAAVRATCR